MNQHDDTPCLDDSFHHHEMNVESHSDRAWSKWVDAVCNHTGLDSLDGYGPEDGYSLDQAYDAWLSGKTPREYADSIVRPLA